MNFVDGELAGDGLRTDHFDLEFDPAAFPLEGISEVTAGVRPEDIYLERNAESVTDPSATIEAATDVLEPMGDEIFVYLSLDGTSAETMTSDEASTASDQLLMSVDPDETIEADQRVSIVLDRSKVHLFDVASGEAITHGVTDGTTHEGPTADAETTATEVESGGQRD